jgi:hypothetical protein
MAAAAPVKERFGRKIRAAAVATGVDHAYLLR